MPKAVLLRTERPVLLPRERETHEWYEANDPAREFDLEVVYDNSPGGWVRYSEVFRSAWNLARARGCAFINSESDVTPTMEAFRQVLTCREKVCMVPYVIYEYNNGRPFGHSATIETRVPGGWDAHLAAGGEEWAVAGDMGFLRFSKECVAELDIAGLPEQPRQDGLLNQLLYEWLKLRLRTSNVFHLHWPALKNAHLMWDSGDAAHHPVGSELWNRDRPGDRLK